MAEHLPHFDNKITLSKTKTDAWGMPTLIIDCEHKENELAMLKDILMTAGEMAEAMEEIFIAGALVLTRVDVAEGEAQAMAATRTA